jgi:hypothetical protein
MRGGGKQSARVESCSYDGPKRIWEDGQEIAALGCRVTAWLTDAEGAFIEHTQTITIAL